jgi:hypothetical protein
MKQAELLEAWGYMRKFRTKLPEMDTGGISAWLDMFGYADGKLFKEACKQFVLSSSYNPTPDAIHKIYIKMLNQRKEEKLARQREACPYCKGMNFVEVELKRADAYSDHTFIHCGCQDVINRYGVTAFSQVEADQDMVWDAKYNDGRGRFRYVPGSEFPAVSEGGIGTAAEEEALFEQEKQQMGELFGDW